ncbi:MAG TPA: sulfurtransferase-like selenium metabolism protein YedF [Bacteroidales bacterium]|nr:sulfurtransferase-like selenium metabolism protein YedF [Bacteroidales bacterium]HPS16494.1 sulfurtransferase-like selenium metabolism protein YedF [Bacteroidales bacterium]
MKIVDAKGKLCPVPIIMTKKAINEIKENESLKILIDNETSVKNVTRFLEENGMKVHTEKKGNVFELTVNKTGNIPESANAEDYCQVEDVKVSNYVVSIQRNRLGDGAEELGTILIKGFINTLPEIDVKPKTIVFLNSGIFLALKDSPVLESLKKLENSGVEILACGTCLDYYKKKEELGVGKISNMYDILERLSKAGNVIYP